jgi:hypothetical protein
MIESLTPDEILVDASAQALNVGSMDQEFAAVLLQHLQGI